MNETRNALKNTLTNGRATSVSEVEKTNTIVPPKDIEKPVEKPVEKKKRKVGRPTAVHTTTKLACILDDRGISRGKFYEMICELYPDEPISKDSISRIMSGKRKIYSTATVFRMCKTLSLTPNDILNYEEF